MPATEPDWLEDMPWIKYQRTLELDNRLGVIRFYGYFRLASRDGENWYTMATLDGDPAMAEIPPHWVKHVELLPRPEGWPYYMGLIKADDVRQYDPK